MTATVNQAISSLAYCTRKRSNQVPERIYFLLHVLFRLSTLPCVSRSQPPVAPGEAVEGRDGAGEPTAAGPGAPILAKKILGWHQRRVFCPLWRRKSSRVFLLLVFVLGFDGLQKIGRETWLKGLDQRHLSALLGCSVLGSAAARPRLCRDLGPCLQADPM